LIETPMNTNPVRTAEAPTWATKKSCQSVICSLFVLVTTREV
jgi:hypothetical protein